MVVGVEEHIDKPQLMKARKISGIALRRQGVRDREEWERVLG
jgi:hypothetical protein